MKKIIVSFALLIFLSSISIAKNDFTIIAFHIDLREASYTLDGLKKLIDELTEYEFNTLIVEYEASFPFNKYKFVHDRNRHSAHEISEFVKYGQLKQLNILPLQQTFGHVEYILKSPQMIDFREINTDFSQFCPLKYNKSIPFLLGLIDELTFYHNSKYIHIGADETKLLGICESCKEFLSTSTNSKLFYNHVKCLLDSPSLSGNIAPRKNTWKLYKSIVDRC